MVFTRYTLLLISTICSLGSSRLFVLWAFLEIIMLSTIVIISRIVGVFNLFKYFLVQGLAGSVLLLSALLSLVYSPSQLVCVLLFVSLIFKLGVPPLHHWFLSMAKTLVLGNTLPATTFLVFTKIVPLFILSRFGVLEGLPLPIILFIFLLSIVTISGGYLEANPMGILIFSSFLNNLWLLVATLFGKVILFTYLSVYLFNTQLVLFSLRGGFSLFLSSTPNLGFILFTLSLRGFPPLPLFWLKVLLSVLSIPRGLMCLFLVSISLISRVLGMGFYLFLWVLPTAEEY